MSYFVHGSPCVALHDIKQPLRVIDVKKTLANQRSIEFTKPKDWNFHVLSHTWNRPIRELSHEIGKQVLAAASASDCDPGAETADEDAYSRLFQQQDLSAKPCYSDIIRLLRLLKNDGVEFVWFDALCINQCENFGEKDMEIKYMGPYYNLSKGCYVITHGIGYGYAIWRSEEEEGYDPSVKDKLPRWFHRVWTFQEFLLPRKLSFIVQGVDPRFVNVMNGLMKQENKAGFCRCFLEPDVEHRILESFNGSILDERNEPWIRGFELRNPSWRSVIEIIKETRDEVGKWGVGRIRPRTPIKCCNGSYNHKTDKLYVRCSEKDLEAVECCRDPCGGQLGNGGGCMEGYNRSGGNCVQEMGVRCSNKCDQTASEQEQVLGRTLKSNNGCTSNDDCRPINSTSNGNCGDNNVKGSQIESQYNSSSSSNIIIQSTASICGACNSTPLIRHASESEENHEQQQEQPLYLFDREVFLALMQCHSNLVRDADGQPLDRPSENMQFLRGVYCALETEGNWRPCHAICEVGHRECTEGHEEDRVLSILGLIGVQVDQVRTGKRLREQVVEIVKMGGGVELVIELCTMNQKGGIVPGFSWAPDFHGRNMKLEYALRPIYSNIEVQGFGEGDGSLKLMAKIARAHVHVVPAARHILLVQSSSHNYHNHDHDHPQFQLQLSIHPNYPPHGQSSLSFHFQSESLTGSFQIPFNPSSFPHFLSSNFSFPVRLLLLGTDERQSKLVMVCIPRQKQQLHATGLASTQSAAEQDDDRPMEELEEELHKIGSFALLNGGLPDFHRLLEDGDMEPCVVGGFGDDLTPYIQINKQ